MGYEKEAYNMNNTDEDSLSIILKDILSSPPEALLVDNRSIVKVFNGIEVRVRALCDPILDYIKVKHWEVNIDMLHNKQYVRALMRHLYEKHSRIVNSTALECAEQICKQCLKK